MGARRNSHTSIARDPALNKKLKLPTRAHRSHRHHRLYLVFLIFRSSPGTSNATFQDGRMSIGQASLCLARTLFWDGVQE